MSILLTKGQEASREEMHMVSHHDSNNFQHNSVRTHVYLEGGLLPKIRWIAIYNIWSEDRTHQCLYLCITVKHISGLSSGVAGSLAGGSFISKVLLANADALCAAASPLLEQDIDL